MYYFINLLFYLISGNSFMIIYLPDQVHGLLANVMNDRTGSHSASKYFFDHSDLLVYSQRNLDLAFISFRIILIIHV